MKLKVGYAPLFKASWLHPGLESLRQASRQALAAANVEVIGGESLVSNDQEALALLDIFERERVDAVVFHFLSFAPGSLVPLIAERLKVPYILWSMPEPPMTGGRIAANSFCAVNMNAHTLWKLKLPYLHVHAVTEAAAPKLRAALGSVAGLRRLRRTKLGVIGHRVPGFYTSVVNELLLRRELGVEIVNLTVYELVQLAQKMPADRVAAEVKRIKAATQVESAEESELARAAALYLAFLELRDRNGVDLFTVRCWPEFSDHYGIGVCAILGWLTDQGLLCGCEGDVYGTVTMALEHELTGQPPFFCDLISIDGEGDTVLAWHCGAAPAGLCRPGCTPALCKHSIIDGGDRKGLTGEFPLRPGRVTLARLSETRDNDGYRMVIVPGTALETERIIRGNPLRVKFDVARETLVRTLLEQGFEHHFAMIHGDVAGQLADFCRLAGVEPLVLK